jgi:archaemetzincin
MRWAALPDGVLLTGCIARYVRAMKSLLLFLVWIVSAFGQQSGIDPVGHLSAATALEREAFGKDAELFQPKSTPGPDDWMMAHPEPGQTYDDFRDTLAETKPQPYQTTLCVMPLGEFPAGASPSLSKLRDYCEAFFSMPTALLKAVPLAQVPAKKRIHPQTQKAQLLSTDILSWLASKKPPHIYAVIAVTMTDLYPEESWNYVFGQASLRGGVGVFSFARYHPSFFDAAVDARTPALVLRRSMRVLTHEMGHMFGIRHCIYFQCCMNGSNHLEEADSKPLHLCPVCLRKLFAARGFDLIKREESLQRFFDAEGLSEEADWSARRLKKLRAAQ